MIQDDKTTQLVNFVIHKARDTVIGVCDRYLARDIGNIVFDINPIQTGLVSTSLIDKWGYRPRISKCTLEHFHARQQTGLKILQMGRSGAGDDEIKAFIQKVIHVNLVTKDDNNRLRPIQSNSVTKDLDWAVQYKLAGIKLVKDPGSMPKTVRAALVKQGLL